MAELFAADILKQFGVASLVGSRIYFVSDRSGHKEIWSMNYDGSDQKQFTSYRTITTFPVVSPDGTKIAFTTYPLLASSRAAAESFRSIPTPKENLGQPQIYIHSLETGRKLVYYNQQASFNAASDFTPDNRHLLTYSSAGGHETAIFMTDLDGSNIHRLTHSGSIDVEAKVNPKSGAEIVFVSGRGGMPQLYRMSIDGTDVSALDNRRRRGGEPLVESRRPARRVCLDAWIRAGELQSLYYGCCQSRRSSTYSWRRAK